MKLIVGLGNPGPRYSRTRHNAGRLLAEFIGAHHKASFKFEKKLQSSVASISFDAVEVKVAYSETFMNVSGPSVLQLVRHFDIDLAKDLLIAVDDVALPFGKLRLRGQGSDGGHNGLTSIQEALGSAQYARLRIGMGPAKEEAVPLSELRLQEYVLLSMEAAETKALPEILERGMHAVKLWATDSIERAMNVVNA